jgi:ribosomal protein S8
MKKVFLLLSISMFLSADIDIKKEVIQVGVFKNTKHVDGIKNALKKYDIYVKLYPNKLQKVFVINIEKKGFIQTLTDIKKISPKAFRLSENKKFELTKDNKPKKCLNNTLLDANQTNKLDSKAIIKTRKKFFE